MKWMAITAGAALLTGGCDSPAPPQQRVWPLLVSAEWAPEQRPLVRVDDSELIGVWEGESPAEDWPAPTLTIEEPNVMFCGNSFMGSVDGVFYDEQGRAVDITPTTLKVTQRGVTGYELLPDGSERPAWETRHYRAYMITLDGERYLGLAPTDGGFCGWAPHRWHKIAIRADAIEITWSGAVVHWMAGMQALEDAGAEVVGEPGSDIEPKFRRYITGSLQRFLEFHQRIADRDEFWQDRTMWRRTKEAGQDPTGQSKRPEPRQVDGKEPG